MRRLRAIASRIPLTLKVPLIVVALTVLVATVAVHLAYAQRRAEQPDNTGSDE